jgi:hypothetical protein
MINIKHKNSSIQLHYCKKNDFKNNIISKCSCLFILMVTSISCMQRTQENQTPKENEYTNMTFKQKEHDFGNIPSSKSISTLFKFSNSGENPLLIKEVTTSCGCTVPEWSKGLIEPNENGEIKIVYDAKYPGRFNKTITVIYNGKDSPLKLTIKGEVLYPEEKKSTSNKIN